MSDTGYRGRKTDLTDLLNELSGVAPDYGLSLANRFDALSLKLAEERFVVVVAGEFKRGKSTFIDGLLGAPVLPAGVIPLTSVVTLVTSGVEATAEIHFRDGRSERVDLGNLGHFVTERGNPSNRLGVDRAFVRYPCPLLDGVLLVDTPGVGSVHEHNTEVARAFLAEADAAVFLISADQPVSSSERAFLEEVQAEAVRTFFVLNKIDHLAPGELEEARAFAAEVLSGATGERVELFALSARQGLEAKVSGSDERLRASGLPVFEAAFAAFITEEKGSALLRSVGSAADALLTEASNAIRLEEQAMHVSLARLQQAAEEMGRVFAEAARARDDLHALAADAVRRIMASLDADLAVFRTGTVGLLRTEASGSVASLPHEALRRASSLLDDHVKETLRAHTTEWLGREERKVVQAFGADMVRLSARIDEINGEVLRSCGELLGISLEIGVAPPELPSRFRLQYGFVDVPSMMASLLPEPGRLTRGERGRRKALRSIDRQIPQMVDTYSGRLRWGFLERLEEGRRQAERGFDRRLDDTTESIRQGIARALEERRRMDPHREVRSGALRSQQEHLDTIRRRLSRLMASLDPVAASRNVDV